MTTLDSFFLGVNAGIVMSWLLHFHFNHRSVSNHHRRPFKGVSVSNRLPSRLDCKNGKCWLANEKSGNGWVLENPEQCTQWSQWMPYRDIPLVCHEQDEQP